MKFLCLERMFDVLALLAPIENRLRRRNADLGDQIARASESVAMNLSEGRRSLGGNRLRFYGYAQGSVAELTTGLRIACVKGYLRADEAAAIDAKLDEVRAMLFTIIRNERTNRFPPSRSAQR